MSYFYSNLVQLNCMLHIVPQTAQRWHPRYQGWWGQYGAHLGPTGPRWAPCWPHELYYLGFVLCFNTISKASLYPINDMLKLVWIMAWHWNVNKALFELMMTFYTTRRKMIKLIGTEAQQKCKLCTLFVDELLSDIKYHEIIVSQWCLMVTKSGVNIGSGND